jgi:hypothetical protein
MRARPVAFSEIAKIILLRQKISVKRCYFQFKKNRPDLRDPATIQII